MTGIPELIAENPENENFSDAGNARQEEAAFNAGAVATLPAVEDRCTGQEIEERVQQPEADTNPVCPKCGSAENWGMNSWCPGCGYYPSLGRDAEAVANMEGLGEQPEEEAGELPSLPVWAIFLCGGVLAVVGMSIAARVTMPTGGGQRTFWSVTQLGIGIFVLLISQVAAGVCAAFRSSDFTPFDIFLKPVEVWKNNARQLPKGSWRFQLLAWSLTAVFGAVVIIGSIPYSALFDDWGFKKRAKPNLLQAVVAEARNAKKKEEGADSLEEAMNDFVGEAQAEDLEEEAGEPEEKMPKRQEADCIIIGYLKGSSGQYEKILLAAMVGQKLQYVGSVRFAEIPEEARNELSERMIHYRQKRLLVKVPLSGVTPLRPVLMCRTDYEKITGKGRMQDIRFVETLADIRH